MCLSHATHIVKKRGVNEGRAPLTGGGEGLLNATRIFFFFFEKKKIKIITPLANRKRALVVTKSTQSIDGASVEASVAVNT